MSVECILLGPEGRSARVSLPDDVALHSVIQTIKSALDLPANRQLVLRRADGVLLDQASSLAAGKVHSGDRVLVEVAAPSGPSLSGRSASQRSTIDAQQVMPSAYRVLPCYLVVDTSTSMQGYPIGQINEEVPHLQRSMLREPELAEICQLSLITFDAEARMHVELTDVANMVFTPLLATGSRTDYVKPFELLRTVIADDLYELGKIGRQPYRPVVFFLSDGQHNGKVDWHRSLRALTNRTAFHGAPNVIAFGFGAATERNIFDIGTRAAYMPESGKQDMSAKLDTFMTFLLSSLATSVAGASEDDDDPLVIPSTAPAGWRRLRIPQ